LERSIPEVSPAVAQRRRVWPADSGSRLAAETAVRDAGSRWRLEAALQLRMTLIARDGAGGVRQLPPPSSVPAVAL
jgi:hypothetical protein